ncbi:MAG: glutamate 5-kinase [Planctomycetaceae bacterium]|jgi:glutamate 5-kinase|nr:glutamate 5-kinase [Planctomycetaceae bacterium]
MRSIVRDEVLQSSDVIVVKVGTNVLTSSDGMLNESRIADICSELHRMMQRGKKLVLVSSGAVGAGMGRLDLKERPTELPKLQAVAAVGQGRLIATYEKFFDTFGVRVAQVLLTADDLAERSRYLHVRNTFRTLLQFNDNPQYRDKQIIPIVNENDTVSVDELRTTFGDNDKLASLVAGLFDAPLLILLSDVDGLYDRDPSDPQAKLITVVEEWSQDFMTMAVEKHSKRSKGGMASKLRAARSIIEGNGNVIIANGDKRGTLSRIFDAQEEGTIFLIQSTRLSARKRWIGFATQPTGSITLDDGAVRATVESRKSLLPIGIIGVTGNFREGEVVSLLDKNGVEVGRGLTNYAATDIQKIRGKKTNEIQEILGRCDYKEVVHQDNMQWT